MKTYQITLIIIGFIFLTFLATNPSSEEHKEAIKKEINKSIENDNTATNEFQKLGQKLGESIGSVMIDNMVERTNLLIFSITYLKGNAYIKGDIPITIGFFGQVFLLQKYDKDSKNFVAEFSGPDISRSGDYSKIRVQGDTAAAYATPVESANNKIEVDTDLSVEEIKSISKKYQEASSDKYLEDVQMKINEQIVHIDQLSLEEKTLSISKIFDLLKEDSRIINKQPYFSIEIDLKNNANKQIIYTYDFGTQVSLTTKSFFLK